MKLNNRFNSVYDVCIAGSGPAGIILALEYFKLNPGKKVLLIEYGSDAGNGHNALDDSIEITNTQNHHDPYECTNKGFGGTSATWGGRCVMYDEIDFVKRDILGEECTWGIELLEDVKSFLGQSASYFECGEPVFNLNGIPAFKNTHIAEGFIEGPVTDSAIERWSMPTRFAGRYKAAIKNSPDITLVEGFELRSLAAPDKMGIVSSAIFRDLSSNENIEVKAKVFVLAAGTQETTRILLKNKQLFNNLDGVPAALGHYYQGHLSGKIASVRFTGDPSKTDFGFLIDSDQTYLRRRFQFTKEILQRQNLLNTAIWLDNPLYYDPKHKSGAMSFMYLAMITPILGKKLAPPAIAHSVTKGKVTAIHKHLWNIIRQFPNSLAAPAKIFYQRYFLKRKLPGVFLFSPDNLYALHFHSEQIPVYSNRMYLKDQETLVIDYSLSEEDIISVIKVHEVLDNWLRKCGCGKLEYWFPKDKLYDAIKDMSKDGIHQSGTTRIAASPGKGVVDENLKVWGTDNVFICSSSVFPTSGQANPTFLLGAFAARLSKYLTKEK
ncbi:MAG: GMC oxidoreductase [Bacteroidota bacterium]|nr:GMC oxidoreductase [Bacteroidota bacterium]